MMKQMRHKLASPYGMFFSALLFWGVIPWLYVSPPKFMRGTPVSLYAAGCLVIGLAFFCASVLKMLEGLSDRYAWVRQLSMPRNRFCVILFITLLIGGPYFLSPFAPSPCAYRSVIVTIANAQGQDCTETCTDWDAADCGGWSSCFNKNISCTDGIDQNGRRCQGCCYACKVVCESTDLPPTVSGALTCAQWGSNGWCRSNARLDLTASDPQGYAVTITGDAGGTGIACGSSCTVTLPVGSFTASYTVQAVPSGLTASGSKPWSYDPNPPTLNTTLSGTSGSNGWYVSNVSAAAAASDAISGLASSAISVDGGAPAASAILTNGVHSVAAAASDAAGNVSTHTSTVSVDTAAPLLFISAAGNLNSSGWWTTPVQLSATASDATSGMQGSVSISLDNGTTWAPGPLDLSDGFHDARLRASDRAGNIAAAQRPFKIDTKPPAIYFSETGTAGENGWYVSSTTVSATVNDNLSGVVSFQQRLDGGAWQDGTSVTVNEGIHTLDYQATDAAGNVRNVSHDIRVDMTAPTLSISKSGTMGAAGWYVSPVTLTSTSTDNLSGVASVQSRVDGGAWQDGASVTVNDGIHTLDFHVFDLAGNTAAASSVLQVDTVPPLYTFNPSVDGSVFAGIVHLGGTISDAASGISKVEFSSDGSAWLDVPFVDTQWNFDWDSSVFENGNHDLFLRAQDVAGNNAPPIRVRVILDNQPPTVSLTESWNVWESGGLMVENKVIPLKGVRIVISDPRMRYPERVIFEDLPAPSSVTWDRVIGSASAPPGSYTVRVEACDIYGLCSTDTGLIIIPPPAEIDPTPTPFQPPEIEIPIWIPWSAPTPETRVDPLPAPILHTNENAVPIPIWIVVTIGALLLSFAFLLISDPRPAAWRSLTGSLRQSIQHFKE